MTTIAISPAIPQNIGPPGWTWEGPIPFALPIASMPPIVAASLALSATVLGNPPGTWIAPDGKRYVGLFNDTPWLGYNPGQSMFPTKKPSTIPPRDPPVPPPTTEVRGPSVPVPPVQRVADPLPQPEPALPAIAAAAAAAAGSSSSASSFSQVNAMAIVVTLGLLGVAAYFGFRKGATA